MSYSQKIDAVDPQVLVSLDEMFNTALPDIEKHLNVGVIGVQSSEGNWLIPLVDITPGKPTVVDGNTDAFTLNDSGQVALEFEKIPVNQVVLRYTFDYESVLFAIKSKNAFEVVIGPVIKDMIDELRSVKGFNEFGFSYGDYYGTFKRPGGDVLFKELESGGVELRLYSNVSRRPSAGKKEGLKSV